MSGTSKSKGKRWSARVMATSDAMDLEPNIFKQGSARRIALSVKRSAMSMLNFYINRAGKNLSTRQKTVLRRAKVELRKVFHRETTQTSK